MCERLKKLSFAGAGLVAGMVLWVAAPALAAPPTLKVAQIDCLGDTGATGIGTANAITVELVERGTSCAGAVICSATDTPAAGEVCNAVMSGFHPLLVTSCAPEDIAVENLAGPGGATASLRFKNVFGGGLAPPYDVCVNSVGIVPVPPHPGTTDIDSSPEIMNVSAGGAAGPGGKSKTDVPTLSTWGMVAFALLLLTVGWFVYRRNLSTSGPM